MRYVEFLSAIKNHLESKDFHCSAVLIDDRGVFHISFSHITAKVNEEEMYKTMTSFIDFIKDSVKTEETHSLIGPIYNPYHFDLYDLVCELEDARTTNLEIKMGYSNIGCGLIDSSINLVLSYCNTRKNLSEIANLFK